MFNSEDVEVLEKIPQKKLNEIKFVGIEKKIETPIYSTDWC